MKKGKNSYTSIYYPLLWSFLDQDFPYFKTKNPVSFALSILFCAFYAFLRQNSVLGVLDTVWLQYEILVVSNMISNTILKADIIINKASTLYEIAIKFVIPELLMVFSFLHFLRNLMVILKVRTQMPLNITNPIDSNHSAQQLLGYMWPKNPSNKSDFYI